MEKMSLVALAREHLDKARGDTAGRSAETIYGGHDHALRQTIIALVSGASLDDHESPGDATIQVITGRIRLVAGDTDWDGRDGDLLHIPPVRHRLDAIADSAVLLTVVKPR
jgi:quercetin dioxygenase-like cupin family protein